MNHKIAFFVWGIAIMMLSACGNKNNNQNAAPPTFPVVNALQRNVAGYTEFPTHIQGRNNNEVRAKIPGYIARVMVDEGQRVQKGQVLFQLETNMLTQNASAAQAAANAAQASIAAAQANVNAAEVEVNKLIPLVEKNIISNVQLETAKARLQQAKSQQNQAMAAFSQAQADYQSVKANMDYSIIRSPVDGIVGALPLKTGSLVSPSDQTPLTVVSDTKELYAYFSMNEKEYLDFLANTAGENIHQKLSNLPLVELVMANGVVFSEKGKIETVTGQVDPFSGSVQFRVTFQNKNGLLTNGNSGIIRIPKTYDNVIVVPESATFEQQGVFYVYKVVKDTAQSAVIRITDRINNMAIIHDGLQGGEAIVADGVGNLKSGVAIQPAPVDFDSLVHSITPIF